MHQQDSEDRDESDLIGSISDNVIQSLDNRDLFDRLERMVWPDGPDGQKVCDHTFRHLQTLMDADNFPERDYREDVFDVMRSRGGFCDCEIMLNVAPNCEFRERYWKQRTAELEAKK